MSVACHQDCKLAKMCEMSVHLPLQRELCPFDLAPVTSTALQMVFGDTVAIALMQVHLVNLFTQNPLRPSLLESMIWN